MKRYIRAETRVRINSDEYKIVSDTQTLKLKFIDKYLGEFYFSDDEGNRYKYDRGAFSKSKFKDDLYKILYGDGYNLIFDYKNRYILIRAKTSMRMIGKNEIPVGVYELVSPKIIGVEDNGYGDEE